MNFKILFLSTILALSTSAHAFIEKGWDVSNSNAWRLSQERRSEIFQGSTSKLLTIEEAVAHKSAIYTNKKDFVNSFTFAVGCSISSKTPIFKLKFTGLDISLNAVHEGYTYARFLVDENAEVSLRGQVRGSSIVNFYPFTQNQEKAISNIFMQLREGTNLKIALLQGPTMEPKVYEVPLNGFMQFSDAVIKDCEKLHSIALASGKKFEYLPDYLSQEPENAAPKDYTLKEPEEDEDNTENVAVAPKPEKKKPEVKPKDVAPKKEATVHEFEPDGGVASIGSDGMPIGAYDGAADKEQGGTVSEKPIDKSLEFDGEGNPIFN